VDAEAEALLKEAARLQRQGSLTAAADCCNRVLAREPTNADALYQLAQLACQQHRLGDGIELARQALAIEPRRARTHVLLGMALAGLGRMDEALSSLDRAIACQPDLADAHGNRGDVLTALGRLPEAVDSYDRALALAPASIENLCNRGAALVDLGRIEEALANYDRLTALEPRFPEGHFNRAHVLTLLGRDQDALAAYDAALALRPEYPDTLANRGNVLRRLGRTEEALASFERALASAPDHVAALVSQGDALRSLARYAEALASYDRAVTVRPQCPEALMGRGAALIELNRLEEALGAFDAVAAFDPASAGALGNRGFVLNALNRPAEALASCDRALAIAPGHIEARNNRGVALTGLDRHAEAIDDFDKVLASSPGHIGALRNRAMALMSLKRFGEAIACQEEVLAINPDHPLALGDLVDCHVAICDWSRTAELRGRLMAGMKEGRMIVPPFLMLRLSDDLAALLECARRQVAHQIPPGLELPRRNPTPSQDGRIRIAYLSADFHRHATAYLAAGLFERHDRERFEVIGVSFGPDDKSAMRARVVRAFDRFIDVTSRSDREIATLLRDLNIDIAIDLKGHTKDERLGIFAHRAAPVQVSYLGYPGTTGAEFLDYVIADPIVAPAEHQRFYTEQIVHLPDSYQVNDSKRERPEQAPPRAALGLPERGFVFCCFNQPWKIDERIFDIWMRLLGAVDGSVLWLFHTTDLAAANLRKEAGTRGIAPDRLVFARLVDLPEHVARLSQADLFLDTLPYGAHTTASDALWAGVPVVTVMGQSFPGRVGASLLSAIGLPELVTHNLADYEAMARKLATDPARLAAIRRKLAQNRLNYPLFDTDRFRRHIEAAYMTMWDIWQRGEKPRPFRVDPIGP
jgi:protein O-GlcNAc transferase